MILGKKSAMRKCVALAAVLVAGGHIDGAAALPSAAPMFRIDAQRLRGGTATLQRVVSFRHTSCNPDDPKAYAEEKACRAHMRQLTVMLVKTLVGSSVLTLSGGVAGMTNLKWAWVPASIVTMIFALASAYTYCMVGKCCNEIGVDGYTDLWSTTISPGSAWIPTVGCIAYSAISCQVYLIVMRDTLAQLIATSIMALPIDYAARAMNLRIMRRETHLVLLGVVMLPLCLLRSLSALACVSWVGMGGVVYLAAFIVFRWITGAYLPGGKFSGKERGGPPFGKRVNSLKSLVFASLLHGCYQVCMLVCVGPCVWWEREMREGGAREWGAGETADSSTL